MLCQSKNDITQEQSYNIKEWQSDHIDSVQYQSIDVMSIRTLLFKQHVEQYSYASHCIRATTEQLWQTILQYRIRAKAAKEIEPKTCTYV